MFYYFQCSGVLTVIPMLGSVLERGENRTVITDAASDTIYTVDAGTLEIFTAEQVAAKLTDTPDDQAYDKAKAEDAVRFFEGISLGTIAAANEHSPDSIKGRVGYLLATIK